MLHYGPSSLNGWVLGWVGPLSGGYGWLVGGSGMCRMDFAGSMSFGVGGGPGLDIGWAVSPCMWMCMRVLVGWGGGGGG